MTKEKHLATLADIRSALSQHSDWRKKLFDSPDNTKFQIDAESIRDVFPDLADKIETEHLIFIVEKENGASDDDVVFKFYPRFLPEFVKVSFNNPQSS